MIRFHQLFTSLATVQITVVRGENFQDAVVPCFLVVVIAVTGPFFVELRLGS